MILNRFWAWYRDLLFDSLRLTQQSATPPLPPPPPPEISRNSDMNPKGWKSILCQFLVCAPKCISTSVDSTIYWQYTFEMFHLPPLFDLLRSSDPGHKSFKNMKQAALLVCGKPKKDVYGTFQHYHWVIPCLSTLTMIFELSSNFRQYWP